MGLKNKKLKTELLKCNKQDIVDAICIEFDADRLASNLLRRISEMEGRRALDEEKEAFDQENKAMEAYIAWNREIVRKYGDGKEAKIIDIPQKEYERGVQLGRDWENKRKKAAEACAKVERILKL